MMHRTPAATNADLHQLLARKEAPARALHLEHLLVFVTVAYSSFTVADSQWSQAGTYVKSPG